MEQMEVLAEAHVHAARMAMRDLASKAKVEKELVEYCEAVDGGLYSQLVHLFHGLYRTGKADNGGLNPLRPDFGAQDDAGLDQAAMTMIRGVRENVMNNGMFEF